MRNRLVPRSEWFQFFDAFSRRHQGRIATVHVFGPKIGFQVEACGMPLEGIVSNRRRHGADRDLPGCRSAHFQRRTRDR